jgi:mannose-1-phosphate guanylyltransferase
VRIECRIEPEILGTGGGIRNTADFWGTDPFIVINADILTDVDLLRVLEEHRRSRALATLILHDRSPFNKIQVDADWRILEIPREPRSGGLAFTGIHVLDPQVLSHIPDTGFSDIVDTYRTLIQKGYPVRGFHSEGHYWHDIGSPPDYIRANRDLSERPFSLDSGCRVDPTARMEDWAVLGADVEVGKDAVISRSILWENVRVLEGARVRDSIVTDSRRVESDLQEEML